ncbi:hypothetical protein ABD76_00080 [Paenibacillus dendritiformis]|nr:hypothetical protein [Paenibacillus dendritiformis]
MQDFGSLDKRNAWVRKIGLCLIAFASWGLVFRGLIDQAFDWRAGLVSVVTALVSIALLFLLDRIKIKGFVVFCGVSSMLSFAALMAG